MLVAILLSLTDTRPPRALMSFAFFTILVWCKDNFSSLTDTRLLRAVILLVLVEILPSLTVTRSSRASILLVLVEILPSLTVTRSSRASILLVLVAMSVIFSATCLALATSSKTTALPAVS